MARSIGTGRPIAIDAQRQLRLIKANELTVQPVTFFSPAKGLDTTTRLSHLDRSYSPVIRNYVLNRGRLEQRSCVAVLGASASSPVMYAADFIAASGTRYPFRFTTAGIDRYDLVTRDWVNVPGITLTGNTLDFFGVAAFGSKLMFSNGVDGLYSYDPQTGIATKISTSSKVPSAKHLATFNNRVVATNVTDDTGSHPNRVRWSTKNNETFWDEADQVNIGAGVEDPQPSTGLEVESCRGVFPVTESTALLIMSNSIRVMTETGFVDAPFKFSYLIPGVGTDSPYSLAQLPVGGVVGFFKDNFYVISTQAPVSIGDRIIDDLLPRILDPAEMFGDYDPIRQEYRVIIKETGAIWRYSFREKGWTTDFYPWTPKSIAATKYDKNTLTVDQLVGTIDSLIGTIDDLGLLQRVNGLYINHGLKVTREDPELTLDDEAGTDGTEIRTGMLASDDPLKKIEMVEIQLEYETLQSAILTFDWSSDSGLTWHLIGSYTVLPTNGSEILSVRRAISAKQLQIRMTTVTPIAPKVIGLHVFVLPGGMRKP